MRLARCRGRSASEIKLASCEIKNTIFRSEKERPLKYLCLFTLKPLARLLATHPPTRGPKSKAKMKYAINEPDAGSKSDFDSRRTFLFYFFFRYEHESQHRGFVCGLFGLRAKNNIPIAYFWSLPARRIKSCDSLYFRFELYGHVRTLLLLAKRK